ncbi:hypothetical protein Dsin_028914 [Dipteronia sinensis]|uniref:peroxidase n=1 Tax=Dipteronia sinensis TaxID=43782 RepID=A0AAE0DUQ2_9ROSI|nr:hypothetical protein Dsin_028914 [Dipteronia sinensis]
MERMRKKEHANTQFYVVKPKIGETSTVAGDDEKMLHQHNLNCYSKSCPRFKDIMRDTITDKQITTPTTAAATLRLFFHDTILKGVDIGCPNTISCADPLAIILSVATCDLVTMVSGPYYNVILDARRLPFMLYSKEGKLRCFTLGLNVMNKLMDFGVLLSRNLAQWMKHMKLSVVAPYNVNNNQFRVLLP